LDEATCFTQNEIDQLCDFLASPEKVTAPISPASATEFTRDAFNNYMAAKLKTAQPAASDLRERAQRIWDSPNWTIETLVTEFAAIRVEGWAEGEREAYTRYSKDHADLVKVMYAEREKKVAEAKAEGWAEAMRWIEKTALKAANRPSSTDRSE
jgi:hypothetical protein